MFQHSWLIVPVILTIVGSAVKTVASSSILSTAQRDKIQRSLPSGWTIRLPEKLLLSDDSFANNIQVSTSNSPHSLSINLFTCENRTPSCLLGNFSVQSRTLAEAQQALKQHRTAAPITLEANIKGYLLEGPRQNPPNSFSSVMWEQDNLIYSISFPAKERQNILYMARSMVTTALIPALSGLSQSSQALDTGSERKALNLQTTQAQTTNLSQLLNPIIPRTPEQKIPTLPPRQGEPLPQPIITPSRNENQSQIGDRFVVKRFDFVGEYKGFTRQQLEKATKHLTGREITFVELLEAEAAVRNLYTEGCNRKLHPDKPCYINSDAVIPVDQDPISPEGAVIKIQIIEGSIEKIIVTGTRRLNPDYVRSRLELVTSKPLNTNRLLRALQLLQLDPLIKNISAELAAGSRRERSVLEVKVTEADSFNVELFTDNGRAPSVGSFRRGVRINQGNLIGFGDSLGVVYSNSDGSNSLDFSYTIPFNPRNGTIRLTGIVTSTNVIEPPFDRIDITGNSHYYELSLRQPVIQTPTKEFALGLTASRQESQTTLLGEKFPLSPGADEEGRTRISAVRFFQEWTQRNPTEVFAARSQFSLGIGAFDATINEEPPDSRFFAWRGQVQYVRLLAPETLLVVRSDVQLANRALLPLEQFGLGGFRSVRGYRQDALLTDNGVLTSAEVQIPIYRLPRQQGVLQVIPFIDFGTAWNSSGRQNPDPSTLLGVGLGVQWRQGDRFIARFEYGIPLIEVDSSDRTLQEKGLYFSLQYSPF